MDVEELAGEGRRDIARLRGELAEGGKFLTRLGARVAGADRRESEPVSPAPESAASLAARLSGAGGGTGAVPETTLTVSGRGEKRAAVREILSARPGRWTTRQVRDELTHRGIEPEA